MIFLLEKKIMYIINITKKNCSKFSLLNKNFTQWQLFFLNTTPNRIFKMRRYSFWCKIVIQSEIMTKNIVHN